MNEKYQRLKRNNITGKWENDCVVDLSYTPQNTKEHQYISFTKKSAKNFYERGVFWLTVIIVALTIILVFQGVR